MATFPYSSLNSSLREIRLLVLHPASPNLRDSVLEMSIMTTRLGDPVTYQALSYTWGDSAPNHLVLLDGKKFKIRKNLHEALLHFRPLKGRLNFWVDAICINQNDMRERESQVTFMRDIYKEAEQVWAWLGPGDGVKEVAAFSFLCTLAAREETDVSENPHHAMIARPETTQWVVSEMIDVAGLQRWLDVADILNSPWFSRMWIIQEVVMSKTVNVVCGSCAVSWDDVIYLVGKFIEKYLLMAFTTALPQRNELLSKLKEKVDALFLSAHRIAEIGRPRAVRSGLPRIRDMKNENFRPPKSVYEMAEHYEQFNVTEPRDRVYALLGILEELGNDIRSPSISYSIPLVDLYWSIIKSYIEHTKDLRFLSEALGPDRSCGIPSWMPHWHDGIKGEDRASPILSLELAPEITYKATAATLPFCYFNPRLKALRIAGFFSAIIQRVGEAVDIDPPNSHGLADSEAIYSKQVEYANRIFGKWVSMLDLEDILVGPLPYQLNIDHPNPTKKEVKAYTFVCMLNMIDKIHEWSPEKLFAMYESKVQMHSTAQFLPASSIQTYNSARQLAATSYRRLFITNNGNFGLCPKATQIGDMIVFLYGCPVPMVLRPIASLGVWRVVGEAYCQYEMNGEMLEPDMVAARHSTGLHDYLFWII